MYLVIIASKCQPFAALFQWFVNDKDPLHVLEWLCLPHTATKTVWTVNNMSCNFNKKSKERLQTLNSQDRSTYHLHKLQVKTWQEILHGYYQKTLTFKLYLHIFLDNYLSIIPLFMDRDR